MARSIGTVTAINGHFFARDAQGIVRELHTGDEIYATDIILPNENPAAEITLTLTSGEVVQLDSGSEYALDDICAIVDLQMEQPAHETTPPTPDNPVQEAVGYEGIFTERTGEITDVVTDLRDSIFEHRTIEEYVADVADEDTGGIKPPPVLSVGGGEVDDNFYDTVAPSGSDTTSNTIVFEALQGVKTVQIGGQDFNQSALENIKTSPVTIDMVAGRLTLESYTHIGDTQTIGYTYTTSDNFHHAPDSDVFVDSLPVIVTAIDGQTDSATLSINVIDDHPESYADTNVIQEGLVADHITGNVFLGEDHGSFNHGGSLGNIDYADLQDHHGADNAISDPVVGVTNGNDASQPINGNLSTPVTGQYGELVLNADGSYDYRLDNTNPDVKVIVDGEVIHDIFTYTIIDDDGDLSTTTLDITIAGNSADPHFVVQPGAVDEAALLSGTDPSSSDEIVTGTITGTANNGFAQLDLHAANGNTLTITTLSNIDGSQTIVTDQGILTLNRYTETTHPSNPAVMVGTIDYTYELTSAYDNQVASSDSFDDLITITITDAASHTSTENLVITIADDKPIATDDTNIILEDAVSNTVTGNVLTNDNDGADTNLTPITPQDTDGVYGHFDLNADGSYTYTLDNDNAAVDGLNDGETLTDTLTYTITDGDGDQATANLDITINGATDPGLSVIDQSVSEDGASVVFTIQMDSRSDRDVTFDYGTLDGTAHAGVEYIAASGSGTINAGSLTTTVTVPLGADDYLADDGKTFDLNISNVNSAATISDGTGVATITDDSNPNTPYVDNDSVVQEATLDAITLKIIAVDSTGTPLHVPDVNGVNEGESAYYKVIVVDSNNGDAPVLDHNGNPASGTVNINLIDGTATGGDDFDNTVTNVQVNTVFSIDAFTDVIADQGETFEVQIADDTSYSAAADYEQVIHDLTPVTTVIDDTHSLGSFVFAHILDDVTVDEADGASLTHRIELMKLDGTPVNLPSGEQVTIDLEYRLDATEAADFQTKVTQVVINGDGGSIYSFSNIVADDFLAEVSESYTLRISNVDNTSGYFSDFYFGAGRATGTINDEPIADVAQISLTGAQTITEGDLSTAYTLLLDQPAADVTSDITVNLSYSGVAQDGVDYTGVAQVIIAAGTNTAHFNLTTIDDTLVEGDESFTMTIDSIVDTNFEAIQADPTADSVVTIIRDDVSAHPETAVVVEGGDIVALPNLLDNDEIGNNGHITSFTYTDESGGTQTGAIGVSINTQYGEITVNSDGSWTYTSDPHEEHPADGNTDSAILTDVITYTITDDNGDTSASTLSIDVRDTIATIDPPVTHSLDEDDLPTGPLLIDDATLGIHLNHDPITDVAFDQTDIDTALSGLTSSGTALTYVLSDSGHTLTASAGGTEVFVITLNQNAENSTYDFELKAPLDHSASGEDTLNLTIPFNVHEQGANEDVIQGNMRVDIVDDVPTAVIDVDGTVVEGGAQIGGNVLTNDIQGADTAQLHEFSYTDTAGATQTSTVFNTHVNTATGTLTVQQDGTWTFTPLPYVDHNDPIQGDSLAIDGSANDSTKGSFSYTLIDGDGDISNEITQTIHVTDGVDPHSGDVVNAVDEDDLGVGSSPNIPATTVTGDFDITGGTDPIEKVEFTNDGTGTLTSNGVAIDYVLSNGGLTLTGNASGTTIFVATVTGTLTNPTYKFDLQGPIDHDAPTSGADENTKDIVLTYKGTDIDGDATTSNLTVTVTDDIPTIGTGQPDGLVDEAGLPFGSHPSDLGHLTTANGTLDVNPDADVIDTKFTDATKSGLPTLTSNGMPITYSIDPTSGHYLLATRDNGGTAETVFRVDIFNPDTSNASYQLVLYEAIDHSSGGGANLQDMTFSFVTTDIDGDSATEDFKVSIKDDEAIGTRDITLDEDGSSIFSISADEIQASTISYSGVEHGTVVFDNTHNTFTYTPTGDYSGLETFRIEATDVDGDPIDMIISATVNPIADAPTMPDDIALETQEDNNNTQEGTNVVALGLTLPIRNDQTDQSTVDSSDPIATAHNESFDDSPERLGLIKFDFSSSGDTINGTKVFVDTNNNSVLDGGEKELLTVANGAKVFTVKITDVANYHPTDIGNADFDLTQAEYERISIVQAEDNANNISLTVSVASHEVQDDGSLWSTDIVSTAAIQNVDIDVQAVTDPVSITLTDTDGSGTDVEISGSTIHVNFAEDTDYDFSGIIGEQFGDLDGSETYKYQLDGLPKGAEVTVNGTTIIADGVHSVIVPFTGQTPTFSIKPPANFSGDINGITIELVATDHELSGEADIAPLISDQSATVTLNLHVESVPDDVTINDVTTPEDTAVKFIQNLTFTDTDGSESLTGVRILSSSNPDLSNWTLRDHNGNAIPPDSSGDYIITDTQANLLNYTLTPPAHSSLDTALVIGLVISDNDGTHINTTTFDHTVQIEITPVAEANSDSDGDGNTDVTLNLDHTYTAHADEDAWFDLNTADAGFALSATNEDDKNNSSNSHASEGTTILFDNVSDGSGVVHNAQLQYSTDGGNTWITHSLNSGIEVPLECLNTVQIKAPNNYSGDLQVDMTLLTLDHDEDNSSVTNGPATSLKSTLTFSVDPVADGMIATIAQAGGKEDAGREADGTITAANAVHGIVMDAEAKSSDTDGSEHINVYFDKIPEDAAIYYDIDGDGTKEIITINTTGLGSVADAPLSGESTTVITDNGDGTWKLLVDNYTDTGTTDRDKPIIIPQHNSNENISLELSGYSVDSNGTVTVTSAVTPTYKLDVIVQGVADDVVNNEIFKQDIVINHDADQDLTVTLVDTNPIDQGLYSAVVEEDMSNTQVGAEINLKDIYKAPNSLDSYDNLYSNDPSQTQISDTSVSSEAVSVTITGLDSNFDVHGATLVNGTDATRLWVTTAADIAAGKVTVTTVEHFSGEINFKIGYVTTENDGDTNTSTTQDVSLLVTPEAEGITTVLDADSDVSEDKLFLLTFNTTTTLPDSDEYVSAIGIAQNAYTEGGHTYNGVDGADFTIYLGNSTTTSLQHAAATSGSGVTLVTENGVNFYKITDPAIYKNLYVLYDSDIGGKEVSPTKAHQTDFGFKFDVSDKVDIDRDGNGTNDTTLIDTESGFQNAADYTFNLTPVTDDITADAHDGDITDIDGDANADISVNNHHVLIKDPTTINVAIKIDGVNTADEPTSGNQNGLDADSSEQIRHIQIDGVPDGIGIVDGKYIGDVVGQPDTGIWLVDLTNPIDMDGSTQTYNLKFIVDGNYNTALATPTDIKISVINQEYDTSGTPQATAQTGEFTLTFERDTGFSGTTTDAPMDIIGTSDINGDGTINEHDGYTIDPNFTGFVEDTETTLNDIIYLEINDGQGNTNDELGQQINSPLFSITVEDLDLNVVDVSAAGKPIIVGTTSGWHTETVNGKDILSFRGSGNQTDIEAAMDALKITPKQDINHNNTDDYSSVPDISFTTTLTTYTQSGVKDVVSTDFSGNIEPVTDPVSITPDQVDATEDIESTISFTLDTVDNNFDPDGDGTNNIYAHLVTSPTDDTAPTTISMTYKNSTDVGHGQFGVTLGGVHFNPGETHDVPVTLGGGSLDLTFKADSNESGKAFFEYTVFSKEDHAQNTNANTGTLEIDIAPVADGLNTGGGNPKAEGLEDQFIQITDASGNAFSGDLIDKLPENTTPEELKTVIIDDVPVGWLVYYGAGHILAQNLGDTSGSGKNTWNIPLSGITVPEMWVKAPEQLGGVTETFQLKTGVIDGGQTVYSSVDIDVKVKAVADPITMNPSPAGGVEGEKIQLHLNTSNADVDGSEHYEVQLKNLGEGAVFYLDGNELPSGLNSGVSYDRGTDTYTISDSIGMDYSTIDKLEVIQNDMDTSIEATIIVHDGTSTSTSTEKTFHIDITQQHATANDDTLLYDVKGVDGLAGDDTVVFGTDWDGQNTIDMSALKNIETLDLTQHGDHHLTITGAEVTAMTGNASHVLDIQTDAGDTITLKDDGDNIWLKNGNDFTNIEDGSKVTVNDPSAVTIERTAPTGGDDIIGFDGQDIQAGAGNDRIVALDGIDIDFNKLHDIETLDLSKSGDHNLETLSLTDILDATDTNNALVIEGDDANDKVTLAASDWDQTDSTGGYTTYTGVGDPTVTLKVDDDIHQTIA